MNGKYTRVLVGVALLGLWAQTPATAVADDRSAPRDASGRSSVVESSASDAIEPNVVAYSDYRDPLITLNRAVFRFNDVAYRYALVPLGETWMRWVPEPGRDAVAHLFDNLRTPGYAVNHLLRLDGGGFARAVARFAVNSTIGLGGLFDPAERWLALPRNEARFGGTLAHHGFGYGIYLVIPLAGPSDARGLAGLVVDAPLSPIPSALEPSAALAATSFDEFQRFAPSGTDYEGLVRKSEDPYLFFRNLHLQGIRRDAEE